MAESEKKKPTSTSGETAGYVARSDLAAPGPEIGNLDQLKGSQEYFRVSARHSAQELAPWGAPQATAATNDTDINDNKTLF